MSNRISKQDRKTQDKLVKKNQTRPQHAEGWAEQKELSDEVEIPRAGGKGSKCKPGEQKAPRI